VSRCKLSEQNFENFIIWCRFSKKTQKYLQNVPILATSGRQNCAMITDRRKLAAKLNLYGMSSFHFHCWNLLKLIPLPSTLCIRTFLPPNVSLLIIGCVLRTMRYICNHQVAPLTICIKQMGAIRPILFTIKNSNCAKKITLIIDNL